MSPHKNHSSAYALYARARRVLASVTIGVLCFQWGAGSAVAVSSWNPTLLVSTESFETIDRGDGNTAVDLRFGASTNVLTLLTTGKFQFNKSLSVLGGISGSYLTIDQQANISGALMVQTSITTRGILSGQTLRVSGNADIHGALSATGAIHTDSDVTLNDDQTAADVTLTFGQPTTNQTLKFLNAQRRFEFSTNLNVLGSISGRTLTISGNTTTTGSVVLQNGGMSITKLSTSTTGTRATLFSVDQMALGQNEGGAYFGRIGLTENQWSVSEHWTTSTARDSSRSWKNIAMSSDGRIQTAVANVGQIYTSTNYGVSWTARDSSRAWYSVAMSSDGKVQTATVFGGRIYTSTDYGATWTSRDIANRNWFGVAMSSDGKIQTAAVIGGNIYTSTDYGASWTARDSSRNWYNVAMSSDGKIQTATVLSGQIYTSTNYGATWTARDSSRSWYSVAMSSDGKNQSAVVNGGQIYTSADYGATWTARDSSRNWAGIAMSSDGRIQSALDFGYVYTSTDYGVTWIARDASRVWSAIAMSSDGRIQTAVASSDFIYTSYATSSTFGGVAVGTGGTRGSALHVVGSISGSRLTISGNANLSGALTVARTVSGANLTFMGVTSSYILGKTAIGMTTPKVQLEVAGTLSGKRLSLTSDQSVSSGALFVRQQALATGALIKLDQSGRGVLALDSHGDQPASPHLLFGYRGVFDTNLFRSAAETLKTTGNLAVQLNLSGSSFYGAGLGDCNNSTSSKLIYNATTGKFSCATDQTGGGTGGTGGNWSNTGSLRQAFDDRYVNQHGDTMTGNLIIRSTSGSNVPNLTVIGGMSGYFLRASGPADIHGTLAASGAIRTDSDLTLNDDRTTSADAILTFGNSTANQTLKFIHSLQRFEFSTSLRVLGTISGSLLRVDGNADVNGTLSLSGSTFRRAISDPSAPGSSKIATYAADLGGRTVLKGKASVGGAYAYQPALFQNFVMMLEAGGGTTVNGIGTTVTNDTTVSHPAADETFGYMANFATAATNNDTAGTSSVNTTFFRGSAAGANGFFYRARIGVVDTTSIRVFSGLANQTIATMVGADSPAGHQVGFQFSTNRGDANWQFVTKDGTTQNVTNTGIAFTASRVYELTFYCSAQCTSITWRIDNVTEGTNATGTTSSNLPGTTTSLRMVTGVSTLTTVAKNIRMQFSYVEADR